MGQLLAVNAGRGVSGEWAGQGGKPGRTAIDKRPVGGRARVGRLGLEHDEQCDVAHHGGPDQALYAYAREDLDWWQDQLGRELRNGIFGENLTVAGVDVSGALIGERWRIGEILAEVSAPRVPCVTFRNWMGEKGWVKRFTQAGRTGAYLRVLEEGHIAAGDPVEVVYRPDVKVTVTESFRAHNGDAEIMRRLLEVPGLAPAWSQVAERVLAERRTVSGAGS